MVTFNEAMLSNDRTLAIRVGDFTSEDIKSANFKYGYITGDDFTPGGTYAGTATILFTSIVESFKKLDVVYPEIGLLVGGEIEWVKMGKYYIDDIKIDRNANTTEIELMDEMFKLNESFKTDLKYPAQIRDVILEIATKTGVTLASNDFGVRAIQQHVDRPTGDKLTYRDVLSQASQLLGFSCFFNRNGELEVRGLTESGITITADNYFLHGLEKSEVEYQIAGITCEVANDEKLTVGLQTGRSLEIENPLATQETLSLLYYALKDIVYYPYDLSYQGHLKLDVGQWVTIKTNKNETFKVPVLYQSFSFSGGLTSTISADSVAGSDAQYTYGSFVTKKIDQKSTRIQAEVQQQLKYADEEFKKVSNEMLQQSLEYQASVKNELTTSKAELETQIDTAKTQAESNAKAYADEVNQATATVAEQANTTANSLKSGLTQVKKDLATTSDTANDAKTSASEAKQQLTTVANDLSTAKQELSSQASQLQAQASAQSELTKRVSSVEETANGAKMTVSELGKTVAQNGKDITSVTARTKVVEDDLTSTKTTLSQVQTTADNTSQKTATLETGLDSVKADLATTTATADTTKTNLANYQASNDKAVANLQSNLQTANGNISSLQTKIEAVPGQITSAVSAVEGKIPTTVGGTNYLTNKTANWQNKYVVINNSSSNSFLQQDSTTRIALKNFIAVKSKEQYTISLKELTNVDYYFKVTMSTVAAYGVENSRLNPDEWIRTESYTFTAPENCTFLMVSVGCDSGVTPNDLNSKFNIKLERGSLASDYSLATEDYDSDIAKLNTTLTQTANGLEQLSTQVTSQGSTITSHTNSINSLSTGLSAKVSQTDFNALSSRVTTAENNITAKANELSSKISSLNVGNKNYLPTSRVINRGCTNFSYNETSKSWTMTVPASTTTYGNGITFNTSGLNILLNGGETLYFGLMIKASKACSFNYDINNALSGTTSNDNDDRSKQAWSPTSKSIPANVWTRVWFSYTAKANVPITENNSNFGIVNNTETINIEIKEVMVAKSNVPVDYQTPDADFEAKNTELKQTTDSIKASVSALDKSTVKSASLTINTDGIVMKAGKSTADVANAIGSYFAVNQNAINLFSDKINVKGSMIVDGAITSTKIASKSINTAHLNGKIITADVIATGAITADAIKAGAVTTSAMTANSINGDRITAGTLDAAKIKAGSITASQIASGTITSNQIKAGGISAANIATGAITADKIAANAIDVSKITGDTANFVKAGFKSLYSNLDITGERFKFTGSVNNESFEISNTDYLLKLNYNGNYAGINPLSYGGISIDIGSAALFSIRCVRRTDSSENILLELNRSHARIGTQKSYIEITDQKISIVKNNQVVQKY